MSNVADDAMAVGMFLLSVWCQLGLLKQKPSCQCVLCWGIMDVPLHMVFGCKKKWGAL